MVKIRKVHKDIEILFPHRRASIGLKRFTKNMWVIISVRANKGRNKARQKTENNVSWHSFIPQQFVCV